MNSNVRHAASMTFFLRFRGGFRARNYCRPIRHRGYYIYTVTFPAASYRAIGRLLTPAAVTRYLSELAETIFIAHRVNQLIRVLECFCRARPHTRVADLRSAQEAQNEREKKKEKKNTAKCKERYDLTAKMDGHEREVGRRGDLPYICRRKNSRYSQDIF